MGFRLILAIFQIQGCLTGILATSSELLNVDQLAAIHALLVWYRVDKNLSVAKMTGTKISFGHFCWHLVLFFYQVFFNERLWSKLVRI